MIRYNPRKTDHKGHWRPHVRLSSSVNEKCPHCGTPSWNFRLSETEDSKASGNKIKSCTHDGKFKKTPGYSIALLDAKME